MKRVILIGTLLILAFTVKAQTEVQFQNRQVEQTIKVEIYPNPTTDYLNIQIAGTDKEPSFYLHNIIGNQVKIDVEKEGDNKYRIKVENLSPGYYLLAIKEPTAKFTKTLKFLKR